MELPDAQHAPSADEDLVARAVAGDASAFDALVDRHRARLLAQAQRLMPRQLQRRVAASDVVQESCLAAFRSLGSFEDQGPGSFGRWLRGVLANKVREQVRHHLQRTKRDPKREITGTRRPDPAALPATSTTVSKRLRRQEEAEALVSALEKLPADHGTILRLVHDAGMTIPAAATQMGRSPEATRKLYTRAVSGLARIVGTGEGRER